MNTKEFISANNLGWQIRKIANTRVYGIPKVKVVRFENDDVSFQSPCFSHAEEGDTWAVKYEKSYSVLGCIEEAYLLERKEKTGHRKLVQFKDY